MKRVAAFSALAASVIFFGVVLTDFLSGQEGEDWAGPDRTAAQFVLSAKREHAAAIRISNSGGAFSQFSQEESSTIISHYTRALEYAESVTDPVLGKIHPDFKQHWEGEFEEGLRLLIGASITGDNFAALRGSMLHDRFADWWNRNKEDIKIPRQ